MSATKLLAMALIAELKLDSAAASRPMTIMPRTPVGIERQMYCGKMSRASFLYCMIAAGSALVE